MLLIMGYVECIRDIENRSKYSPTKHPKTVKIVNKNMISYSSNLHTGIVFRVPMALDISWNNDWTLDSKLQHSGKSEKRNITRVLCVLFLHFLLKPLQNKSFFP